MIFGAELIAQSSHTSYSTNTYTKVCDCSKARTTFCSHTDSEKKFEACHTPICGEYVKYAIVLYYLYLSTIFANICHKFHIYWRCPFGFNSIARLALDQYGLFWEALLIFNDGKVKKKKAIMPTDMYHWTLQATAPSYKCKIKGKWYVPILHCEKETLKFFALHISLHQQHVNDPSQRVWS